MPQRRLVWSGTSQFSSAILPRMGTGMKALLQPTWLQSPHSKGGLDHMWKVSDATGKTRTVQIEAQNADGEVERTWPCLAPAWSVVDNRAQAPVVILCSLLW